MRKMYIKLGTPNKIKIEKKTLNSIIISRIEMPTIIDVSVISAMIDKKKVSTKCPTSILIFCTSFAELVFKWNM